MGTDILRTVLYRFALPLTLLAACIVRYNGLSLIWLIFLLIVPLFQTPSRRSIKGRRVQEAILATSVLIIISHIAFQIALVSQPPYGHVIDPCTLKFILARQFGYTRFDGCNFVDILRLIAPDVIVFVASLVCVLACRGIKPIVINPQEQRISVPLDPSPAEDVIPVLSALMLLIGGITQPNLLSSVYFLTFLIFGSCWAFHKSGKIQKSSGVLIFKTLLTCYCGLHLVLLYLYQMDFFQTLVDHNGFYARLLGLPDIIHTGCQQGCQLNINKDLTWPFYVYPVVIFILYQVLATEMRYKLAKRNVGSKDWFGYHSWNRRKFPSNKEGQRLLAVDRRGYQTFPNGGTANVEPEEPALRNDEQEEPSHVQGTFSSIMMFLMRQSYIASLIIMMTWSITYHSWMTFVLLLWACLTWITPFARWFCMVSSPYLVIYAEILLIAQYVYGFNLKKELPSEKGDLDFAELGLKRWQYPCLHLGAQTLFVWVFWLTLRQHIREKKMKRRQVTAAGELVLSSLARPIVQAFKKRAISMERKRVDSDLEDVDAGPPSDDAKEFMHWIKSTLSKYWIIVCCAAFLLVALQNNVSIYQIVYMVIFLFGFIVYQFSVRVWKIMLRPLWWFMVIYSILILLTVYTYQFQNMHTYWSNGTHLSDQWLHDLGLRQHTKATLLVELLIPTIFSIVLVIQLHFFHKPLMMKVNRLTIQRKQIRKKDSIIHDVGKEKKSLAGRRTVENEQFIPQNIVRPENKTLDPDSAGELPLPDQTWIDEVAKLYSKITSTLWRLGEIHALKVISLIVMLVAVQQVSAINALFVVLLAISMPSMRMQKIMNYIMIVWASVVILVMMFYQLKFVKDDPLRKNCTTANNKTILFGKNHFASNAWWIGFQKSERVSMEVRGYIFIVLTIVAAKVIKHHEELQSFKRGTGLEPGILFAGVTRQTADKSIASAIKYLCNNFFDSFGFEINLMVMVVCMGIRCDAYAVFHSLWVVVFLLVRRKVSEKLWPFYVGFLAILLPIQYLLILGWPPGLCFDYPWHGTLNTSLVHWLYLTDTLHPQSQMLLLADYLQLTVACCQEKVFARHRQGKKSASVQKPTEASTSKEIDTYVPPDFMVNKTWLDFVKIVIFEHLYWLTLSIIYITAQNTNSLFNFGFIVNCFFFLWHGQSLYLRPRQTMRRWWKVFIAYNFFVIVFKVWLQLVSCVWINKIPTDISCVVIQLLNLYCLHQENYKLSSVSTATLHCKVESDTGLTMDSVCFIFALIQYRIFKSIYFKYVIKEHRRQADMAGRGAQLVEERLQIRLADSIEKDKSKMEEIRSKVNRLKTRRSRLKEGYTEPYSHYEAIYSGDSYFLDTDDSDDDASQASVVKRKQAYYQVTLPPSNGDEETTHESDDESTFSKASLKSKDKTRKRKSKKNDDEFEPVAGPSRDAEEEDSEDKRGCAKEFKEFIRKSMVFFGDVADHMITIFNEISEDYRSITLQLERERKDKYRESRPPAVPETDSHPIVTRQASPALRSLPSSSHEDDSDTWSLIVSDEDGTDGWQKQDSRSVRFAVSLYYALLANTDLICYAFMIINHMYYACILSLPLPFFVFLWGMLSIPRPTKRFWIACITYVELAIVIKYVFQFRFFGFNDCSRYPPDERNTPLCPPRIIGIERNAYSSVCDLLLLLALFFHRFALKAHGLWREKAWNEEEDTVVPKSPGDVSGPQSTSTQMVEEEVPAEIQYQSRVENPALSEVQPSSMASSPSLSPSEQKGKKSLLQNIKRFIQRMLDPDVGTGAVDVFAWMFGCQFAVFLIIAFSWSAFSSPETSERNFAKIIEENVVPKTFLYMLLTQFLLIVIDRILYLKKYVFAKLLYLALLMFLFHVFMFLIVPELTNNPFTKNVPAIFMYIFQCIYFGLSAYQVRCGYPTRILGNFLTKSYTLTSGILFQGIQAIPFLLELRSVLDWMCTETTLSLTHWLKIEDIYANIYILKCWRDSEKTWPQPRGMKYWLSSKWLLGGLLVFLLIVVIWFPLLFMSFINSAYISNSPVDATFTLTVGGYQPLFKVSAQKQFLRELTKDELKEIVTSDHNVLDKWNKLKVDNFLESYPKSGNVVRIRVLGNSNAVWAISPPSRESLIKDLYSNATISIRFKYEFYREPNSAQAALVQETVSGVSIKVLEWNDTIRVELARMLQNSGQGSYIKLKDLFPSFIQVPASGRAKPVAELGGGSMVTCHVRLRKGGIPQMNYGMVEWWDIVQVSPKPIFSSSTNNSLEIITFNDFVPPLHLSFFASKGIIGLYVGFVWLIGKFVRLFFTSISYRIMFDEMPNVDKVLKLCLEIYMVRESKELELEEDLFAKLMFLYRSPETLIKWTKYKRH